MKTINKPKHGCKIHNNKKDFFDCVFFGASILNSLEACYQAKQGKSVLLVDRDNDIGGAWKCISFENFERVENAVHYFLPHESGINFMRDYLNLPIIPSEKKYRFFFGNFVNVFARFFDVFARFSKLSDMFGPIPMFSNLLGRVRTHSDALTSLWTYSSNKFRIWGSSTHCSTCLP